MFFILKCFLEETATNTIFFLLFFILGKNVKSCTKAISGSLAKAADFTKNYVGKSCK